MQALTENGVKVRESFPEEVTVSGSFPGEGRQWRGRIELSELCVPDGLDPVGLSFGACGVALAPSC